VYPDTLANKHKCELGGVAYDKHAGTQDEMKVVTFTPKAAVDIARKMCPEACKAIPAECIIVGTMVCNDNDQFMIDNGQPGCTLDPTGFVEPWVKEGEWNDCEDASLIKDCSVYPDTLANKHECEWGGVAYDEHAGTQDAMKQVTFTPKADVDFARKMCPEACKAIPAECNHGAW